MYIYLRKFTLVTDWNSTSKPENVQQAINCDPTLAKVLHYTNLCGPSTESPDFKPFSSQHSELTIEQGV